METLRVVRDPEEAELLWEAHMPGEVVTDLWDVRACFNRHFRRPLHFMVQELDGRVKGLLPLSWVEECGAFAFFPGETWHGKTWLEQNLIVGEEPARLLEAVPGPYHIRYLSPRCTAGNGREFTVDEIGYLFTPPRYGWDMDIYFQEFSGKSIKRIRREIQGIKDRGLRWRYDRLEDFDTMIAMNVSRFGQDSYFGDPRFREGFRTMIRLFADRGWLRVTTALIDDEVAAVDVGVLYDGTYTLLGGGTNPSFPGIAKVINVHHMERACEERMREVDFLCGDFNWKKMFHLQERPLYLAAGTAARAA
ncbi:MAG: GNAT family N-acetyltransferase [bacterium]|nr:MAG: GNAT family N-acetyltransferase [bacterium]